MNLYEFFYGEDQGRYIIEIKNEDLEKVSNIMNKNSVFFEKIGTIQKDNLTLKNEFDIPIKELIDYNNNWFKNYMK